MLPPAFGRRLRTEEGGFKIGIQNTIPQRFRDAKGVALLFDSGVVDQDIDAAEGGDDCIEDRTKPRRVEHIGDETCGGFIVSVEFLLHRFQSGRIPPEQRHFRAGTCERVGDGASDAARCAGYDGDFAIQ